MFVAIGGTFPEGIGERITERCWSSGVCCLSWTLSVAPEQLEEFSKDSVCSELWGLLDEGLDMLCWVYAPSCLECLLRDPLNFWGDRGAHLHGLTDRNKCILNLLGCNEALHSHGGVFWGCSNLTQLNNTAEVKGLIDRHAESQRTIDCFCDSEHWVLSNCCQLEKSQEDSNSSSAAWSMATLKVASIGKLLDLHKTCNGPSGAAYGEARAHTVYTYSTNRCKTFPVGITVLNESNERGGHVAIDTEHGAVYLHVDDTLCFTHPSSRISANLIMTVIANEMERFGFLVPERFNGASLKKAVGYEIEGRASRFALPPAKLFPLHSALLGLSEQSFLDVELLR